MSYNEEYKIRWEELAPSLRAKFTSLIKSTILTELQSSNSDIYKQIVSNISNEILNSSSSVYKNIMTSTVTELGNTSSSLYQKVINIVTTEMKNSSSSLYKSVIDDINTEINNTSSNLYKSLGNTISDQIINQNSTISKSIDQKIANSLTSNSSSLYTTLQTFIGNTINDAITGKDTTSTIYSTMRSLMFTNLPPKVGFLDDTKVNLYGAFNMSFCLTHSGIYIMSDAEGRETAFARSAASSISNTQKVFRGYRMKRSDSFIFDNDPIVCGFFKDQVDKGTNVYASDIYGLTDDYIILNIVGGTFGSGAPLLIFTQTSGTPENWTETTGYLNISSISAYGNGILRFIDSNNKVWYVSHTIGVDSDSSNSSSPCIIETNWNGSEYRASRAVLYFYIYQVTEDLSNHSITINSSRTESLVIGGPEIWGTSLYDGKYKQFLYQSVRNSPRFVFIKEYEKLYITYSMYYRYYWLDTDQKAVISGSDYGNSFSIVYDLRADDLNTTGYFSNKNNLYSGPEKFDSQSTVTSTAEYSTNTNLSLSYSSLTKTLYLGKCDWDGYWNRIIVLDINNSIINSMKTARNLLYISDYTNSLTMPDTSPWGKKTYCVNIIGSACILYSASYKYGSAISYITPTLLKDSDGNVVSNSYLISETGRWKVVSWPFGEPSTSALSCCRNANDTSTYGGSNWYYVTRSNANNQSTFTAQVFSTDFNSSTDTELELENGDKVQNLPRLQSTKYTVTINQSNVPTDNIFFNGYSDGNNSLGKKFIVIRYVHSSLTKSGTTYTAPDEAYGIIYTIDASSGSVSTYKLKEFSAYSYSSGWVSWDYNNFCLTSALDYGRQVSTYFTDARSNIFVDSDGSICYRVWNYRCPGVPAYSPMWFKIDLLNKKLYYYGTHTYWYTTYHSIGYQNQWGYFHSECSWMARIYSTKDKFNSTTYTDTLDSCMLETSGIEHSFPTSPTTNRVAYLQKTALYLGGYFSYIEAQEVYLNEGDNYIYINRDTNSYNLTVEVYDTKIGIEGASQFNRILIAYVLCSNGIMVYQKNYEINNYGGNQLYSEIKPQYSTEDITAGTTELESGTMYLVYEE